MNLTILKQIILLRKIPLMCLAFFLAAGIALQVYVSSYQQPKVEIMRSEWLKQRAQEGRGSLILNREMIYKNGMTDLNKFMERIYSKSQFTKFIAELYETAAKNRLDIGSIAYKPSLNKDYPLLQYELNLSVSGKYPQLKKFIYDLNQSGNLLHIDSLAFSNQGSSAETVQLQLQITSYFRMEAQ